jgi:ubiquinone/menaquinone biosynthesis C-methylase UbiE
MFTELGILKLIKRLPASQPFHPMVAMLGVKSGDRVLIVGAGGAALAAVVARVTGLNGQTTVVGRAPGAAANVALAAAAEGALVDFIDAPVPLVPLDNQTWDIAVLPDGLAALGTEAPSILNEAIRVVRPGGRVTVCEPVPRQGLFKLTRSAPATDPADVVARLTAAGLKAGRYLGTLDRTAFIEAARAGM